jgi:SAM-dependent methyltransferase
MSDIRTALDKIFKNAIKLVISNKKNKAYEFNKIIIQIKVIDNSTIYQIEKYTDKQVFHENLSQEEAIGRTEEFLEENFKQLDAWSEDTEYTMKLSKKDKVLFISKPLKNIIKINTSHNREKNYILKEGTDIPALVELGVFTKEGKVVNSMYDKYKQINRFIELVDDVIKKQNFMKMNIIDFGCGKSYLTFVLYHYLVNIKRIEAHIIGLDLKEDVIRKCSELALKYNYTNLKFEIGNINNYKYEDKVDMVITLHACDTATDYALYNAINWGASIIMSVPCCQHELNSQIKTDKLSALTKYGLIKERFSALATDTIRGCLLEYKGYQTQLLEFVDLEHSPKNILIRAIKTKVTKDKSETSLEEATNLMKEFGFEPTLYKLLK